jgi:hypothetical protein
MTTRRGMVPATEVTLHADTLIPNHVMRVRGNLQCGRH